jgi:signal transduction histidine kinase
LGDHGAVIDVKIPAEANVFAHPNTFTQVLFNLLSNAVKFHAPGVARHVVIIAHPTQNGFTRVSVTDKGIGIAPQHTERIFQVFERLHGPEAYPGTGIGLAIVKRGVERMRGRYGVESEVGQGSTFWVELPAAAGGE